MDVELPLSPAGGCVTSVGTVEDDAPDVSLDDVAELVATESSGAAPPPGIRRLTVVVDPIVDVADDDTVPSSGMATLHERTSVAPSNGFPESILISVSPEKFPQNICAVLVLKTAEFCVVKADAGAPGDRSGSPSAFWTPSQLPRHDEG